MSVAPVRKPASLVDQEQALTRYLEALFSTVAEGAPDLVEASQASPEPALSADMVEGQRAAKAAGDLGLVIVRQGDLQLAFPLVELAGVRAAPEGYARPPRIAPGVLGLYAYRGQHIPVVSLEYALDMPLMPAEAGHPGEDPQVLILGDGRWGLQVDSVLESLRVPQDGVRWRDDTQRAPWLKGYVRAGLISLIDVAALIEHLDDKRRGMETAFNVVDRV